MADDFLTDYEPGVTADLVHAFENSGKSQISVMEVNGSEISKYGVIVPNRQGVGVVGLVEKPDVDNAPSNLASIGRYVLTPDIFETLYGLSSGSGGEIQLADAINIQAKRGSVGSIRINGLRFDCGSVEEFIEASNFVFNQRKNK